MTGGGILALLLSLATEGFLGLKVTSGEQLIMLSGYCMALVIIANIIGYNLYGYLLTRYSATFLSFAGFMTPLFAALLGWLFLGEQVTWHFFATISMVILGLYLFYERKLAL